MLLFGSKLIIRLIIFFSAECRHLLYNSPYVYHFIFLHRSRNVFKIGPSWHQPRNSDIYDSGWSNFELTRHLAKQQKHVGSQCRKADGSRRVKGVKAGNSTLWVKIGGLPPPKNVDHRSVLICIKPIARRKASLLTFLYPCISMISCSCSSSQPLILEVLLAGLLFLGGLVSSGLEWKGQKG